MKDKRTRQKCLSMYVKGFNMDAISQHTGVAKKTLYNWRKEDKWDDVKEVNFTNEERINNSLSDLVIKMLNTAKQKPGKNSLDNLDQALKIYDEHQRALLIKPTK